jgi:hypothetical protein
VETSILELVFQRIVEVKRLHDLNGQKIVIPLHKVRVVEICVIGKEIVNEYDYCGVSFFNFRNFAILTGNQNKIHFNKKYYSPTNKGYIIKFGKHIFDIIKKEVNDNYEYYHLNPFIKINVKSRMVDTSIGPLPNYDKCVVSNTNISYEVSEEVEKYLDSITKNYWYKNQKFINNLGELGFNVSNIISQKREENIDNLLTT